MRVVLINDQHRTVADSVGPCTVSSSHATVERLRAPSVYSPTGVTLAGQTFGTSTGSGRVGGEPHAISLGKVAGGYVVSLPAASAALVTIAAG